MKKRIAAIALGITFVAFSASSLAGCTSSVKDTIVFGLSQSWETLNVSDIGYGASHQVACQIYDKLVYVDEDYNISARGADSWEFSDDGLTLTFQLNQNAKWHDGEPVTAADYVFSIKYYASSEAGFTQYVGFGPYIDGCDSTGMETSTDSAGAEVGDNDYELVVHLRESYNQDNLLSTGIRTFYVIPQHCFLDDDGNQLSDAEIYASSYWDAPIGSGPYMYTSEIIDASINLTAFDDYYLGTPTFETLIMQVVDSSTAIDKILAGDLDVLGFTVDASEALTYLDNEDVTILTEGTAKTPIHICFNCSRISTNIRKAVEYAIDKQDVIDKFYNGDGAVSDSLVNPSYPGAEGEHNTYDPDKAQEYVDAAVAAGEWDTENDTLLIGVASTTNENIMTYVSAYLNAVGINTSIKQDTIANIIGAMYVDDGTTDTGDEYGCGVWCISSEFSPSTILKSISQNGQRAWYKITQEMQDTVTEIYEQFLVSSGDDAAALIAEFQEWEHEYYPVVTLAYYKSYSATSTAITGVDAFNTSNYNYASWAWERA